MSMLAERRQKQKWSLNPRGKWWTEDSNKFGQRMLEKMGWTKGKGLGINEQGIAEFSSTSYKNDTAGIGYDKNFEVWTEYYEKFGNFLQQLNGNQNQDAVNNGDTNLSGQSIELKSKQSQARVHYKKFMRGKDIHKYKSKDLANIFGQKELAEKTQIKVEEGDNIIETEASGSRDNWYGVVTINSGNMADYFKLKSNYNTMSDYLKYNMKAKDDTSLSSNMTDNRTTDSESETDQHAGFGFTPKAEDTSLSSCGALKDSDDKNNYAFDNPCLGLNSPTETACNTDSSSTKSTKKRKKKFESDSLHASEIDKHNTRKKLKTETVDSDCKSGFINPALNLDTKPEDCNGKEFEVFRAQFGLENCGLDLTDERNDKKRVTFNDHVMLYEYNINSSKKKKGEVTLDKFEVENKKNKKKRKHENTSTPVTNGFVNEALDIQILYEEINDNELNEHRNKKVKKRKICKTSNLETIQESPEKEIIEIDLESEDTLNTSVRNGEIDTVEQKSKKKKKKKKEKEEKRAKVEDITVIHVTNEDTVIGIEETIRSKKNKKDKESKEEEMATSKKCKKKKKKDKENCKSDKHTIQTEISNEQQDIKILDKSNSKQQNNYLIEHKNKDAAITETLPVSTTKEEEEKEEPLEKIKHKKKKSKCSSKENCTSEIDVCSVEREISDKENNDKEQDPNTKKLAKRDKKSKKSKNKNVSDIGDSSNPNKEVVDVNVIKQDKIENAEFTDTPSKMDKVIDAINNINNSPWSIKAKMSKKMLITLFHNNAILEFPGSNIKSIKGYGTDVEYEL